MPDAMFPCNSPTSSYKLLSAARPALLVTQPNVDAVGTRPMCAPIVLAQTKPTIDGHIIVQPLWTLDAAAAAAAAPGRLSPASRKRTAAQLRQQAAAFRPRNASSSVSWTWAIPDKKPPLEPRDTNTDTEPIKSTKPIKVARTARSHRWSERVEDSDGDDELPPLPWADYLSSCHTA